MNLASKNIAVLISGGGTNLQAIIDNTKNNYINGKIKIVISNREDAYGLTRAKNAGIKAVVIKDDEKLISTLSENKIDLIILAGYLKILPEKITKIYENKIINIHPSLLPKYGGKGFYGMHVHDAVFANKEKISGVTVHYVNENLDDGDIILQKQVDISFCKSPEEVSKEVLKVEHETLKEVIKKLEEERCEH